jgi:CheY-like chemotaxis protein/GAF domain-containing protein
VAKTRIGVVDDDPAVRELLEVILDEGGYAAVSVPPGPDLLARLRAARPAAVILDWRVDGGEGTAFDLVRADTSLAAMPLLICTGDLEGVRRHASRLATLPNVVIVEKPFQVDVLLGALERMVASLVTDPVGLPRSSEAVMPDAVAEAIRRRGTSAQARRLMDVFQADGGWTSTELWLPDRGLLRWVIGAAHRGHRGFAEYSRSISLVPGFGLPGRVVSSARPAWIRDVLEDRNFPRAAAARRFGVRGAAGVPVTLDDAIVGVVCGYAAEPRERDDGILERMAGMAAGLGGWLERARGELLRPDGVSSAARRLAQEATAHAEIAAVDLLTPDGELRRAAVAHREPSMAEVAMRLEAFSPREEGPVAVAVQTRSPQRMTVSEATLRRWSASPEHLLVLRALELRSIVAAPLVHQDMVIGGIALSSAAPRWHASAAAEAALEAITGSAACAELGRLVLGRRSRR